MNCNCWNDDAVGLLQLWKFEFAASFISTPFTCAERREALTYRDDRQEKWPPLLGGRNLGAWALGVTKIGRRQEDNI